MAIPILAVAIGGATLLGVGVLARGGGQSNEATSEAGVSQGQTLGVEPVTNFQGGNVDASQGGGTVYYTTYNFYEATYGFDLGGQAATAEAGSEIEARQSFSGGERAMMIAAVGAGAYLLLRR